MRGTRWTVCDGGATVPHRMARQRCRAFHRGVGDNMHAPDATQSRRAVTAAVIGNVLEWYDFAVYGYVATIIAKQIFAPGDELAALLSTFAVFGVGFLARPLGGIIIGR